MKERFITAGKPISIHALREEGDLGGSADTIVGIEPFQSTPSARRATQRWQINVQTDGISIHALREEGDPGVIPNAASTAFQSTPSARRATTAPSTPTEKLPFQSTPSARRATGVMPCANFRNSISIHALREEGDLVTQRLDLVGLFQSTPSARRATVYLTPMAKEVIISIHALREEGDSKNL